MTRKIALSLVVATALAGSGPLFAQQEAPSRRTGAGQEQGQGMEHPQRTAPQRQAPGHRQAPAQRQAPQRQAQHGRQDIGQRGLVQHDERGAGPDHNFHRGDRLPPEYRNRNYVVDDWRAHHLSAPPRGYHWVQSGDDYLLVAITSGIIAQLLLGH